MTNQGHWMRLIDADRCRANDSCHLAASAKICQCKHYFQRSECCENKLRIFIKQQQVNRHHTLPLASSVVQVSNVCTSLCTQCTISEIDKHALPLMPTLLYCTQTSHRYGLSVPSSAMACVV